jgi:hypothetical protein
VNRINDSRLIQLTELLFDAQALGLELVRETEWLPNVHRELISVVGYIVAAHIGTKDVTAAAALLPLEREA